jgi:hypothetical protein
VLPSGEWEVETASPAVATSDTQRPEAKEIHHDILFGMYIVKLSTQQAVEAYNVVRC